MISVRAVSKSFGGVKAVQEASFEVSRGQVVGLLGANGAGKTTTIRMVTGFLPPDAGAVIVGGHDTMRESAAARRSVGYLPESAPAYGEMATRDYLDFRGRLYGMPRRARNDAIARVLALCDLADVARRRVGQLSRGYRQRVGLAAAILHDPPVLVLDEPTSALDPRQIRQTRQLVRDLARDRTVLVSSHILPEVEQTCDRVVIMARGRVKVDARPGDLLQSMRGKAPYIVEARGPAEATLRRVAGVTSVEASGERDGWSSVRVWAQPGAPDLREAIAKAAAGSDVLIRELRRELPGLERVFLELIEAEDEVAAAGRGAA
jgi:gliding motility-associated transport system ATP-binding protein